MLGNNLGKFTSNNTRFHNELLETKQATINYSLKLVHEYKPTGFLYFSFGEKKKTNVSLEQSKQHLTMVSKRKGRT